jgi:RecA/RadA recombinase
MAIIKIKLKAKDLAKSVEISSGAILKNDKIKPKRKSMLSTGSTLLNCACTDNPFGGFLKGHYYFFVGDSNSGKTFLSMSCFAESSLNRHFKDYRLIYDAPENGCLIDVKKLFGDAAAKRIEAPAKDKRGADVFSTTVEDFYFHTDDKIKEGRPFIYVLDSMDALTTNEDEAKFQETKKAARSGKETKGSYGMGKAKQNSTNMRTLCQKLKKSGSILIIISQTRDNVGFGFEKKTRSGGTSLKFYATLELWSSVIGSHKKTVKGKTRKIGIQSKIQVKKNRITGFNHEVEIPIYPSYGIDDIGSCVDYLVDEQWWAVSEKKITARDFNFAGTRDMLIAHIENNDLIDELRGVVGECWNAVKAACALGRKPRY